MQVDCPICGNTQCTEFNSPNGSEFYVASDTKFDRVEYFDDVIGFRCDDNPMHVFYLSTATQEK